VDTPNAQVGVKFSQPDVEVSYDPEKEETVGIAHTVELLAKNILTDEEVLVPVGSSVIITAVGIKVVAGILGVVGASSAGSAGTGTTGAASTGMGVGTKIAIGAGAVAAAGGAAVAAIILLEKDASFAGTYNFEVQYGGQNYYSGKYTFVQEGSSVTGTYEMIHSTWLCPVSYTVPLSGKVKGDELFWSWPFKQECCQDAVGDVNFTAFCSRIEGGTWEAFFEDGRLKVAGPNCTGNTDPPVFESCAGYFW
jgi:hypothetical protein